MQSLFKSCEAVALRIVQALEIGVKMRLGASMMQLHISMMGHKSSFRHVVALLLLFCCFSQSSNAQATAPMWSISGQIAYNGPQTGSVVVAAISTNSVLMLDGNGSWMDVPKSPTLIQPRTLTIEMWFKAINMATEWSFLIFNGNDQNVRSYQISLHKGGEINMSSADTAGEQNIQTPSSSFQVGQWYHVAYVIDRSNGTQVAYLNGVSNVWGAVRTTDLTTNSFPLRVGGYIGPNYGGYSSLSGSLDEVTVWNRALSQAEIQANMGKKLVGTEPGLVAYWSFDDGFADDVSPNGNTGTLVGNAVVVAQDTPLSINSIITVPSPNLGPYIISNLLSSTYNVTATRGAADGAYTSNPVFLTNNIAGVNITLNDPPPGFASITGTVFYAGPLEGAIYVLVCSNATTFVPSYSTILATPSPFTISNIATPGLYWIRAFRDSTGDGTNQFWEAQATYANNPLILTQDTGGINITLADPSSAGDGIPDWWKIEYGLDPFVNLASQEAPSLDGLTVLQKYQNGLDPTNADTGGAAQGDFSDYERLFGQKEANCYYDKNNRLVGIDYNHGSNGLSLAYVYDGNGNIQRQVYLQRNQTRDGVPDIWKFLHGLSYTNANAYTDPNGAGWTVYQYWQAGADPSDPTSISNLLLGVSGTNVVGFSAGFTPSNFVMGTGRLNNIGADAIVIGADGNPGGVTNSLLILTQTYSGWTTQSVAVGTVGITSITVGQPSNTTSAAIYLGTRQTGGTGTVMQVMLGTNGWSVTPLLIGNTSQVAYVLGIRPKGDIFGQLSTTSSPDQSLCGLTFSNGTWTVQVYDTKSCHRGLGNLSQITTDQTVVASLRLLDAGGIQVGGAPVSNAVYSSSYNAWYFLTPQSMTWSNAQSYATSFGGNLVTIDSPEKNSWITGQFPPSQLGGYWIGLNRADCLSSAWKWATGQPDMIFFNWNSQQPDCENGNYTVTEMAQNTGWSARDMQMPLIGVVEVMNQVGGSPYGVIPEPTATNRILWTGHSLGSGFTRQTNGVSIFYTFADDQNLDGQIDAGDSFVVCEFLVLGTNYMTNTLVRLPINATLASQSYGLACANILNTNNDVFFTAEPDGVVYSWTTSTATGALLRSTFDAHHQGKAWHQLSAYRGLDPGEGLAGLMVDPTSPNTCQVIIWGPQQSLPTFPNVPETAPITLIMPTPNSGSALSPVNITIYKAEGNNCYPVLQYQDPVSSNWLNAAIQTIDGIAYSPTLAVTAMPTGTLHTLVWNALGNLGAGFSNNVLLRASSSDFMLTGNWSPSVPYLVNIPADTVGDGIPNWWRAQYFGGGGTNTNSVSCANCDPDGDGMNNLQEYLAGTNPTNPSSVFKIIGINRSGSDLLVTWNAATNKTYIVQVATNGLSGSLSNAFHDLATVVVPALPAITQTNYLDLGAATNTPPRYYRIKLGP